MEAKQKQINTVKELESTWVRSEWKLARSWLDGLRESGMNASDDLSCGSEFRVDLLIWSSVFGVNSRSLVSSVDQTSSRMSTLVAM